MSPLLEVQAIAKSYGGVQAVKDVSFNLGRGEILALIGPNGAGKSTCFNLLNGQIGADAGTVRIAGRDTRGMRPSAIARLGVGRTFQITATFGSMTVIENVQTALISFNRKFWSFFSRAAVMYANEAQRLLDLVGMGDEAHRPCAELAYGDLKRLELAIGLANDPALLLMDEPTAGMAPTERGKFMQLVAAIVKEKNIGVLFTEHDMDAVFAHASRVMVLARGELVAQGTPEAVRNDPMVRAIYLGEGLVYGERYRAGAPA
jgi:branched-chain amino acid transport system ATP-binding protein